MSVIYNFNSTLPFYRGIYNTKVQVSMLHNVITVFIKQQISFINSKPKIRLKQLSHTNCRFYWSLFCRSVVKDEA